VIEKDEVCLEIRLATRLNIVAIPLSNDTGDVPDIAEVPPEVTERRCVVVLEFARSIKDFNSSSGGRRSVTRQRRGCCPELRERLVRKDGLRDGS
jgi:hypothetical protein